jgi:16S rRNA (cytosine967-C5)-methyltransferase
MNDMFAFNKLNHFYIFLYFSSSIIASYDGTEPFHLYLKKYFSINKKHGSRDRKRIKELCYNFFRLGLGAVADLSVEDKLLLATFLMESTSSPFLQSVAPDWNEKIHLPLHEKLSITEKAFNIGKLFPFGNELSPEVDVLQFSQSFLKQPKLYIRIRPGYYETVIHKLNAACILYENRNETCLALANNSKAADVLKLDEEAVIQDYNSQRVGEFFKEPAFDESSISMWDCCAASGGKSILAYDTLKNMKLTVSDKRRSILKNLDIRFARAGIKKYDSIIADLSANSFNIDKNSFDFIIADVPCSGSGTWARTPEQLKFFRREKIAQYALLQQQIVSNAIPSLAKGGYLLYITCSVFKKENEENVNFIQKNLNLELLKSDYLKGYQIQADTLFAALFRNSLLQY